MVVGGVGWLTAKSRPPSLATAGQTLPTMNAYLRRLSRNKPIALMPSAGIMRAPSPNRSTKGATFVMSPGTSEPSAPIMEAALETEDWRAIVAVLLDDLLPLEPADESAAPTNISQPKRMADKLAIAILLVFCPFILQLPASK